MEGSKFLQVLTLLLCMALGYFVYDTNKEVKSLHEENVVLWNKLDSLQNIPVSKSSVKKTQSATSRAASLLDEMVADAEKEYRAAKKAEAKAGPKMTVSSSYRLEDRYVSYKVYEPEYLGNVEGKVVLDITVKRSGDVLRAKLNSNSTINDEETIEACKKAALKTDFNINSDAVEEQPGLIIYTFAKK